MISASLVAVFVDANIRSVLQAGKPAVITVTPVENGMKVSAPAICH